MTPRAMMQAVPPSEHAASHLIFALCQQSKNVQSLVASFGHPDKIAEHSPVLRSAHAVSWMAVGVADLLILLGNWG